MHPRVSAAAKPTCSGAPATNCGEPETAEGMRSVQSSVFTTKTHADFGDEAHINESMIPVGVRAGFDALRSSAWKYSMRRCKHTGSRYAQRFVQSTYRSRSLQLEYAQVSDAFWFVLFDSSFVLSDGFRSYCGVLRPRGDRCCVLTENE